MERRRLIALVGGLALLGGAVVVLRHESAPPRPETFERFLADTVEYVPDAQRPSAPTDLALTALDRTSLRATWTAADGIGHGGFEVRWNGRTRLVRATETELTDLDANADVHVEVRALDAMGNRSAPATADAVPRLAHDDTWQDGLVQPVDVFDTPESLAPHRWRVLDQGGTDCLGLRPLNGKRLEITCDSVDLQSNVPVRFAPDGTLARVLLTTDGPLGRPDQGERLIALLPDPAHDLGPLSRPYPPGAVVLRVTPFGSQLFVGEAPPTEPAGTYAPPTPGVRHRWELRVSPGRVVALRDGVEVATAPVDLPWTSARARLAFRQARGTLVDAFGVGGVPDTPVPTSVVPLGPGTAEGGGTSLGNIADSRLEGASSVRVVASVVSNGTGPITVELGTRSAPAVFMPPDRGLDPNRPAVVRADFPLPAGEPNPEVRLRSDGGVTAHQAHAVVTDGPDAHHPLPRLTDRPLPAPVVPPPSVSVVHETADDSEPRFPDRGRVRLSVELADSPAREVAAVKGLEVDLDGERIAVLPTHGSAGGRHEFLIDVAGLAGGRHELDVRVLPMEQSLGVRSYEQAFEIRPL
ncbi:fibronectin type III domain-containing protein [Saccharothrix sp. S26]|uniref:fibronectin type III domain-containing protein n=1 Tax=Saccharothrix sp. S26 TaxID=2907215 RepID=UPI001F2A5CBC|nr:fibronectin type III domain-containing protein [Saccharothrix sp. S26]MCE6996865.1 fibronectin type III domain-containing protein [Saccharothrix sp. S26]